MELVLAWSGSGRAERLAVVGWETGGVTRPAAAVEKEREREREILCIFRVTYWGSKRAELEERERRRERGIGTVKGKDNRVR